VSTIPIRAGHLDVFVFACKRQFDRPMRISDVDFDGMRNMGRETDQLADPSVFNVAVV
jgi:hypothetical protein